MLDPVVISLIALAIGVTISALVLGLVKPKFVTDKKNTQTKKLAIDRLVAFSVIFGVILALIVFAVAMLTQKRGMGMSRGSLRSPMRGSMSPMRGSMSPMRGSLGSRVGGAGSVRSPVGSRRPMSGGSLRGSLGRGSLRAPAF